MAGAQHRRRRWPWWLASVLAALLVASFALAWWLPARWAWQWVRADYPAVQVGAVGGTLWQGRMDELSVGGLPLGTLHWTLGRAAVWGDVHGSIGLRGKGIRVDADFRRVGAHVLALHDAHFTVSMQRLRALWPAGMRLAGRVQGKIASARLVGGWPARLRAVVRWRDAAVVMGQGQRVALGEWRARWQASGTAVTARLDDAGGGAVALRGTFTGTPLGWRLDATLTPRRDVPGLRRLLRRIGQPAADGSVRIARKGGLMAAAPW